MRVRSPEVPTSPEPVELRWPETPPHAPRLHAPLGRPLRLRSPLSGQRLRGTRCCCRAECLRPQTRDHCASPATPSQAGAPREAGARPRRPPPAGHVGQSFGRPPGLSGRPTASQQPSAPVLLCACADLRALPFKPTTPRVFWTGQWRRRGGARRAGAGLSQPGFPPPKDLGACSSVVLGPFMHLTCPPPPTGSLLFSNFSFRCRKVEQ